MAKEARVVAASPNLAMTGWAMVPAPHGNPLLVQYRAGCHVGESIHEGEEHRLLPAVPMMRTPAIAETRAVA